MSCPLSSPVLRASPPSNSPQATYDARHSIIAGLPSKLFHDAGDGFNTKIRIHCAGQSEVLLGSVPWILMFLRFRLTLLTLRGSFGRSEPRILDPHLPAPSLPSIGIWARHPSISQSLSAHPPRLVPLLRPHTETETETVEVTAAEPHRRCPRGTE